MIQDKEIESAKCFIEKVLCILDDQEYDCRTIIRASDECESSITIEVCPNILIWVVSFGFENNDHALKYGSQHVYLYDNNARGNIPHIQITTKKSIFTTLGYSGKIDEPFELNYISGKSEEYIFQQNTVHDMFSIDTSFCELIELFYTKMCTIHMRNILKNKQELLWISKIS